MVELGGAISRDLKGAGISRGGDVAMEVTPIEDRLELEFGTTPLFGRHTSEWDTDLLFKKPWTLSKKLELMAGLGPEWVWTRQNGVTANVLDGEAVIDLMFWPWKEHRIGWFVEPGYDRSLSQGHAQSIGLSFGLLIGIYKH